MTDPEYHELLARLSELSRQQQIVTLGKLSRLLCHKSSEHSIVDLREFGLDALRCIDAQEWVNEERDSWGERDL